MSSEFRSIEHNLVGQEQSHELIKIIRTMHGLEEGCSEYMFNVYKCVKVQYCELPTHIAITPRNVSIILKYRGFIEENIFEKFAKLEAEVLGREFINVFKVVKSSTDLANLIDEVRTRLEKYYIYLYLRGEDIAKEVYTTLVWYFNTLSALATFASKPAIRPRDILLRTKLKFLRI